MGLGLISNFFSIQEIFEENLGYLKESVSILGVEPEEKEKLHSQMEKLMKAISQVE